MEDDILENKFKRLYYTTEEPSAYGGARGLLDRTDPKNQDNVRKWLRGQDAYTLHKPTRKNFLRRQTIASGRGVQLQADLLDVSNMAGRNDGVRFILTAVDVVSRKGFAQPLQSKAGLSVAGPLAIILDKNGAKYLQTDKGKEFYNKDVAKVLAERKVKHFSTNDDEVKAAMVERFNRSLRNKLHRYLTHKRTRRYIDVLPDLLRSYNRSVHTSIGMAPDEVTNKNQEWAMLRNWERQAVRFSRYKAPKLKVGDNVRLTNRRMPFTRGYTPRWTREIFIVSNVDTGAAPVTYGVKDLADETVKGIFYEAELQKIDKPETYEIEEVLKQRKDRRTGKKQFFVKWLGYPTSFNSWVGEDDIEK